MRIYGGIVLLTLTCALVGCGSDKDAVKKPDPNAKVTVLETISPGKGELPETNDVAYVIYRGTFTDNSDPKNPREVQFDTNMDDLTNQTPMTVSVNGGGMIKGFDETVSQMKVGEERKVKIPWELGYGAVGSEPKIPPYQDLVFDIKVLYIFRPNQREVFDIEKDVTGTGTASKPGDTVEINYVGTYLTGKVWDDTKKRGQTVKFTLGDKEKVIPGINAGMGGIPGAGVEPMKVGGKRTIVIPQTLAFGVAGTKYIQGNQPLRIEIELVSVNGKK